MAAKLRRHAVVSRSNFSFEAISRDNNFNKGGIPPCAPINSARHSIKL